MVFSGMVLQSWAEGRWKSTRNQNSAEELNAACCVMEVSVQKKNRSKRCVCGEVCVGGDGVCVLETRGETKGVCKKGRSKKHSVFCMSTKGKLYL